MDSEGSSVANSKMDCLKIFMMARGLQVGLSGWEKGNPVKGSRVA